MLQAFPELAIVDVETTGMSAAFNRVIEVAVLRVSGGEVVRTYSTLVNPGTTVPPFIEWLTGIRGADLAGAPRFGDIKDEVLDLFDGALFVAHNARFDFAFLRSEFERHGVEFDAGLLCTMRLSRRLFPEQRRHGLDSIIGRHGITVGQRHRALGDASAVWEFLRRLAAEFNGEVLEKAVRDVIKKPLRPPLLSDTALRGLPQTSGVYIFYDGHGTPLYVGKSLRIRERVLSHFNAQNSSARGEALRSSVADVEAVETKGELGALLLEAGLIKKLLPLFNRRSLHLQKMVAAIRSQAKGGYETVEIVERDRIEPREVPGLLGVFRSRKQAKEALWEVLKTHRLCPVILGLEKRGRGGCSYRQIGLCGGACLGEEGPEPYNERFGEALGEWRIRSWPFRGPVAVIEYGARRGTGDAFIVDQWCLVDVFRFDEAGRWRLFKGDHSFDFEAYKILAVYLKGERGRVRVRELTEAELAELREA